MICDIKQSCICLIDLSTVFFVEGCAMLLQQVLTFPFQHIDFSHTDSSFQVNMTRDYAKHCIDFPHLLIN